MPHWIGHFTGKVNGHITGCRPPFIRSCYRTMNTAEVLTRIEERLQVVGLTADAACRLAGKPDAIRNLRRAVKTGARTGVTMATLAALAPVLQTSAGYLLEGDGPQPPQNGVTEGVRSISIPIAGKLAAGVFREVIEHNDDEPEYVFEQPDPEFPTARQVAFIVEGDSLNDLKPRPILDGDTLICVDFEDTGLPLIDGMVVVIQRTRDGGLTLEWSAKQVEIHPDRIEYHPRSTNKNHRPITVRLATEADGSEIIKVLALVRRTSYALPKTSVVRKK